jgi:DNA-binding response OmpR family regulator
MSYALSTQRGWGPVKFLIVDDEETILDALSVVLRLQWQDATVIQAVDGEDGLRAFFESDPDFVILDIAMPGRSGLEVLQHIRRVSDVPVLMLTAHGEESSQLRGFERGADDYVAKPFSPLALIARIKAILRRMDMQPPTRALPKFEAGDLVVDFQNHRVTVRGRPVNLPPVEYRLLYHLVRNEGRLMSREALIGRIWGDEYGHTSSHLKMFVSRLRAKIELPDGPRYIETERGLGYRFVRPKVTRSGATD